ncbi:MAG: 2-C-methyl-D-erythritol 4-phosphate cytidylyltransferase [Proteiniphilum sp.]|nr:2-C-methyl-D-erythritol 4-phosphate cytidylyltransferase [Proteiniphilum sp.]MDD3909198.1 2-C-methyl-D-erythritol 4-phosphate cytidylyltransferase [Proteiniphilum sp.]MDD4416757.1 2-C-methyl-D-erythritol 4-phosphate cytidylyltransferase [Proteiniphilum sp.]
MTPEKKYSVIIVAGGKGIRAGGELPKQFMLIGGKPVLMHSIQAFHDYSDKMRIVVVLPDGFQALWKELCNKYQFIVPHTLTTGGDTRFHSVKNGLKFISEDGTVGVHDAARPFITPGLIRRCFDASCRYSCGVVPVVDEVNSVRVLSEKGSRIFDRKLLKIVQTPQVFPAQVLKKAYETSFDPAFTDDASVAEKYGLKIMLTDGEESNIKITTPFDIVIAEHYLNHLAKR